MSPRRPVAHRARSLQGIGALAVVAAVAFTASPVQADEAADRARAKAIAAAGVAAYEAGRFDDALAKMREADAIFDAPHHDVYAARALKQLGRWVEARASYRAALGDGDARSGFREARALATEELARLEELLPSVEIAVRGATIGRLTIDDRVVKKERDGTVRVDPGNHRVSVGTTDGRKRDKPLRVSVGDHARMEFVFAQTQAGGPEANEGAPYLLPVVGFSVGGAGILLGSITGVASLSKVSALEQACPDRGCPPALQGDLDAANALANVSNVAFVVGGVGVAVGVVTLLLAGGGEAEDVESALAVGTGGGTWRGTF